MVIYVIWNKTFRAEFTTLPEAQAYAEENGNLPIELIDTVLEDRFYKDINFGKELINEFLKDNRQLPFTISHTQSVTMLQKFAGIEALASLGIIKSVLLMMESIEVDAVFTAERKQKYLRMINHHLLYL